MNLQQNLLSPAVHAKLQLVKAAHAEQLETIDGGIDKVANKTMKEAKQSLVALRQLMDHSLVLASNWLDDPVHHRKEKMITMEHDGGKRVEIS